MSQCEQGWKTEYTEHHMEQRKKKERCSGVKMCMELFLFQLFSVDILSQRFIRKHSTHSSYHFSKPHSYHSNKKTSILLLFLFLHVCQKPKESFFQLLKNLKNINFIIFQFNFKESILHIIKKKPLSREVFKYSLFIMIKMKELQ